MALITCPDCGRSVSESASACPGCARPLAANSSGVGRACPHCGSRQVGKVRGLQGGTEVMIAAVLTLCFLLPGVIYYIVMESKPYCSGCGKRT